MARAAAARSNSPMTRYRLAHQLHRFDQFDEAIEILRGLDAELDDYRFPQMLTISLLARETPEDTREAIRSATRALSLAATDGERARSLGLIGKAQIRLEQFDEARASLLGADRQACRQLCGRTAVHPVRANRR